MRRFLIVLSCLAILAGLTGFAGPAQAAGSASVTLTAPAASTPSGVPVTFTLTVSCSVTGGCNGTAVSFPSTAISGDGDTTDFAGWVGTSSCAGVTRSATGGVVKFSHGTVPTGTKQCTFTVAPPEYTTFDNTKVTLTPTLDGDNFGSSSAAPVTLTVTAGHNDAVSKSAGNQVTSGLPFSYTIGFQCGRASNGYTGDIGLSALTITDQLPANFTYQSYDMVKKLPGTVTHDSATRTLTYSDPAGATCGNPGLYTVDNGVQFTVTGTAASNGTADPEGDTVCNTASATFTYLDGFTTTSTSANVCPRVAGRVPYNSFWGKAP
ncbi:MAG TPA: hypothetical protein VHL53_21765 [Acidimicrobiia bacterium]|nr:hypothetical protein [Acidimicrobiia bacterium]